MIHTVSLITPSGRTLSVKASGRSGPVVVFVHGFPLDHRLWIPMMDLLSDRFRLLAPELRGFGGSSLDGDYSMAELAEDIEYVRTHLAHEQSIHLVALSMGGYAALEYWHKYRDHLKSLTLANTKPEADDEVGRAGRIAMADRAMADGAWEAVAPMLPKLISTSSFGTPVEMQLREMMQSVRSEAVSAAQRAMAGRRDFTPFLESIHVPTLVLTGEHDPISPPAEAKRWSEKISSSQYHVIPGIGHLSPLEGTNEFSSILVNFLNSM